MLSSITDAFFVRYGHRKGTPFTLGCWYHFRNLKTLRFPNSVPLLVGLPSLPASTGVIWLPPHPPPLFPAVWACGEWRSPLTLWVWVIWVFHAVSCSQEQWNETRVKTVTKGIWILVDRQSYCRNFDDCWVHVSPKTHMWLSWYCIDLSPHARWISRYFIYSYFMAAIQS